MDLTNKEALIKILEDHKIYLKKSLGQNLLVRKSVLYKIIEGLELSHEDTVLEIGSGIGTLTVELAKKAQKVIGIEIDTRFQPILEETLKNFSNTHIIFEDIMNIDISQIINSPYKLTGNLPYYISGTLLGEYLKMGPYADLMVIMLQREMAERLISNPGSKKYSSLSVFLKLTYTYEILTKVSPNAFFPQPDVESVVLRLRFSPKFGGIKNKELFFKIVKESFRQRRKFLINNLQRAFPTIPWNEILQSLKIDPKRRAETLSLEEFISIANMVENYGS
ncbi:MAG TPA: 16S rRNA (adenine(1518)-N(6)/adenine(1519)-N(6))-dimethyltransferase RsmA [Dictyoglomaceae bacterium]|nr:16S rRNA (adenine(1518)-N(6)/adenine(1519)-N(6))-dimethyltransferase RsmA [Dictyoglomaceae bacterium]HOL39134.1 16S rRNA (adenine(1518)-N(6)/adenine(1519)-N(6))-dimethyltransferase RsmA [Dictyoglomaceae bacterium]HOP94257.1 16S rRNA (adenine(1518)-N(6)/adenine(1519)-N(6))-dimethyltransferase RsmA [Dictyoglomaceae bacterium]HPP15288.1 16S rRNA (adenine(1518)-N(6)/adenine(1519)-N(6))-dimethyltransferase RsmA [Dictyoglomaceae bacterium]HPU42694.1 16S rRNA (adenine(1518)-N(6)/adenine(1519)-N(6))